MAGKGGLVTSSTAWTRASAAGITAMLLLAGILWGDAAAASASAVSDVAVEPADPPDATEDLPDAPAPQIGDAPSPEVLEDLQTVADENEMSLAEATARYGWHESFALFVDDIRANYPAAFAGARIDADGRPWVAFEGATPPAVRTAADEFAAKVFGSSGPYGATRTRMVRLIEDRGFTEAELDRRLARQHFAVLARRKLVANASSGYDIATGQITINAELNEAASSGVGRQEAARQLRDAAGLGADTTLEIVDDVRGGDHALNGGGSMIGCTSGFNVKKNGTRGLTTAAHCQNQQKQAGVSLTFKKAHNGWWGDVQWHTSPEYEPDDFWSGSATKQKVNKRDVAARGNAVEGQSLCRNGKTTQKHCDEVYQLNHCSWDTCHLTAMHNKRAEGGDSGGPWFWGRTAYGIHQGWKWWNFKNRDVFTRATFVDNALPGVYIATS